MSDNPKPEIHTIYHVFLASSIDMNEERQMVRDFFVQFNKTYANQHQFELKVIDWENYLSIGLGRVQELVTKQTLERFKDSLVLFIGLLGQRFGTPTGGYESGTEEEFETVLAYRQAQKDYPEIKWFYREQWGNTPFPNDAANMLLATQQMAKVEAFISKLKPLAAIKPFAKTENFIEIFQSDLQHWLNAPQRPWNSTNVLPPIPIRFESPEQINQLLVSWLNQIASECAHLPLEIIHAKQGMEQSKKIELHDIFVPLKAIAPRKEWLETRELNYKLARELEQSKNEPKAVQELLTEHPYAVVIGDPGSGKSALINQLTWSLVNELASDSRIPVRITLRHVNLPKTANKGLASWLWDAIEANIREKLDEQLHKGRYASAVVELLQNKLMQPPFGLIMLDGLDEVPAADEKRRYLIEAIEALVIALPDCHFIVTARPYAYTDPSWRLEKFSAFSLIPFDQEQREQFINSWYTIARSRFNLRNEQVLQQIPDLINQVETRPHLQELAKRPLLLTLIAVLHASGNRLPDDRAQLYKASIELLLFHWKREAFREVDHHPLVLDDNQLRSSLQTLAYHCHQAQCKLQDFNATADIADSAILDAFTPMIEDHGKNNLLPFLHQHTGILIARSQNCFAFPHRSFQEYLAMGYLTAQKPNDLIPIIASDPLWWREVFLLAIIEQKEINQLFASYHIQNLFTKRNNYPADSSHRIVILTALALKELDFDDYPELTGEIQTALKKLIAAPNALNVTERAEAGQALAGIGDNRRGVGVTDQNLPDILWQTIPAGRVVLEDNKGEFEVEQFELATYPITNAHYKCFIEDGGYQNPRWWDGLEQKFNEPEESTWYDANHPRESVSWYEAMAFCAWASDRLSKKITLPTEWQWQQAACSGNPGFNFPWGKDYISGYANINETWKYDKVGNHNLQRTTAVGLYPQGNSLQGVADLSGNVWEWCLNGYDNPKDTQLSGAFCRVARGGGWNDLQLNARASYRYFCTPDDRNYSIGFRVCVVACPPS